MALWLSILAIWILYISIPPNITTCSRTEQTCDNDDGYCIGQTVKVIYPDPETFFATDAVDRSQHFVCNSEAYCRWAQTWGYECVRFSIDKLVTAAFYNEDSGLCSSLEVPITINTSISCCQPELFNCDDVSTGIREKFTSTYATEHCQHKQELADVISEIVECYATPEFMRYQQCNESDYVDMCPKYFFSNLEVYAKCSCFKLGVYNDTSWAYFEEMTQMIEGIFASFRGKKQENCPDWRFSCNSKGEAQLDVFEIICPLDIDEDTDVDELQQEVRDGVKTLSEDQVEIFGNVIRVLMYSEEEANDALVWLSVNTSDTTPEEIDAPCDMDEVVWNLNEIYGDYVAPETPAPTDTAFTFRINSVLVIVSIVLFCMFPQ